MSAVALRAGYSKALSVPVRVRPALIVVATEN